MPFFTLISRSEDNIFKDLYTNIRGILTMCGLLHDYFTSVFAGYYEPEKEKINKYGFETDRLCFLILKDLKTIVPFPWYYPYSGQWNAYCPFVKIKEIEIEDLSEIINMDIDYLYKM